MKRRSFLFAVGACACMFLAISTIGASQGRPRAQTTAAGERSIQIQPPAQSDPRVSAEAESRAQSVLPDKGILFLEAAAGARETRSPQGGGSDDCTTPQMIGDGPTSYSTIGNTGDYSLEIRREAAGPCIPDFQMTAPLVDVLGNTCGAGDDCDVPSPDNEDHIYFVTLPNDGVWTFSTCGSGFDTYLFVGTACGLGDIGSNDDSCGLQSEIVANLKAGTYWVTIEAFGSSQCGDYILTMSKEEPCDVDCPAGALEEGEACGSDTNGGCNSVPPVYTNAVCGDVFCGTAWADGGTRDTDWYIVEHGGGILSATLTSQFSGVCFILDGIGTCSPVVVGDIGCSDDCENIANASADLPAGTYVVFVATGICTGGAIFDGIPCGSGDNDYVLEINCQVPVADAFLDIKPGSCPNSFNRGSNGVLPVALVGTPDFDVTEVDISSLLLVRTDGVGGSIAPHEGPPGPHSVFEDVATPFDASGACTIPDSIITVEILTDDFGGETTWELVEQGVGVIASGGPYPNATLITVDVDVCSTSCYDFTIFDTFGDGICCGFGIG
ncbi:MAG: hypothetical protein IIA44_16280, partial [Acidobacteria bacterium]|nr:hypothetical protein [Acidobacteriota bacterium]